MIHLRSKLQLENGSRIGVIGGGPSGSLFAFFAMKLAGELGLEVDVTIFDHKDFSKKGPSGCNLCAGVISESLILALQHEGIMIPRERIQNFIQGYYHIHAAGCSFIDPPRKQCTIYTVFRGNGPRSTSYENVSFDDYLLQCAVKAGAKIVHEQVTTVSLPHQHQERAVIFTASENGEKQIAVDLVVGAFGLNSQLLKKFQNMDFGYQPPPTMASLHGELPVDMTKLEPEFRNRIGVFSLKDLKELHFGIMTPKDKYATFTLIGSHGLRAEQLTKFLEHTQVQNIIANVQQLPTFICTCRPRIAIGPARKPYADRLVMIGDASFSRHFKNGIYSCFLTAKLAASTAFYHGISAKSFYHYFYKPAWRKIVRDNIIGKFLFSVSHWISYSDIFLSIYKNAIRNKSTRKLGRVLQNFSWGMMTGEIPYANILLDFILGHDKSQPLVKRITTTHDKKKTIMKNSPNRENETTHYRIKNNDLIAIIGGGPGGVGCAVALKNLAQRMGKQIRVRLYEAKPQDGIPRYNQCVGVLSPPIIEILAELGIEFPYHLVQRTIDGYVLHSDRQHIFLSGESEPSYAVRRIAFDNYLLKKAKEKGIEVVESRVTGVEFHKNHVTLYSESDNIRAAIVVGAFGLDDGSAMMFARETSYRQPNFLNSIVTKWHPKPEFIQAFENNIHAFLPSIPEIEFGAVTPKQNHFTINIAGEKVDATIMDQFLSYRPLVEIMPSDFQKQRSHLSYFKGKFPISIAKSMFGHRYITVGDAAGLVRPFKGKGINSALLSGMRAAQVILQNGVTLKSLKEYIDLNEEVIADMPYGKFFRFSVKLLANTHLLDYLLKMAQYDDTLQAALFNSVSAHKSYRTIVKESLSRDFIMRNLKFVLKQK